MEIENDKTDTHHHFYIQLALFPVLEDKQDHFLQCSSCHAINPLVSSVKMAGYWPCSPFTFLWSSTSFWSMKTQKEKLTKIQPS